METRVFVCLCLLFASCYGVALQASDRASKFLFTIVRVPNIPCTSGDLHGLCYPSHLCTQGEGDPTDTKCANNFGICCIFKTNECSSTITKKVSYILNPGESDGYTKAGTCDYTIDVDSDTCQVKLDFVEFTLKSTRTTGTSDVIGTCQDDKLTITGNTGDDLPIVCGAGMTGQHMYIPVEKSNDLKLSFVTTGTDLTRKWKVRATKIDCNSEDLAPRGCLQYYTELNGEVKSFNYMDASSNQISNMLYTVCVKRHDDFCTIQWHNCAAPNAVVDIGPGGTCSGDYIIIPGYGTSSDRFCGSGINVFTTKVTPFTLTYRTDGSGDTRDGFCLMYSQKLCTT